MAINPLTLKFLLNEFKNHEEFPGTRYQLFLNGCERLCTENNPDRMQSQQKFYLSPSRRLALASRIAAVMTYCNRSAVLIKSIPSDLNETNLALSMLQEGEETTGDTSFVFSEGDIRNTISQSSLFSSRGPDRFGFIHQSFKEFLAARYLRLHQVSVPQISKLIQLSSDPERKVIPQLREVSAWLNSIVPEILKERIETDPQSMLYGDIANIDSAYRKNIVESLLNQFENKKIIDTIENYQYQKLKHPGLATQLKPYIADKSIYFLARRAAIDIAEACETIELQNLLADIALDKTEKLTIRTQAAHTIAQIADDTTRLRLKPLAIKPQSDDTDDGLKGSALRALWPKHLTAKEVFASLTGRKNSNYVGMYAYFLGDFAEQLKVEDIPVALKWVENNPVDESNYYSDKLTENILNKAWLNLDNAHIMNGFAKAIIPRLANHHSICPAPRYNKEKSNVPLLSETTRKSLVKAIVKNIKEYQRYLFQPLHPPQILFDDDFEWLLSVMSIEHNPKRKRVWIEIIHELFNLSNIDHVDMILKTKSRLLKSKFQYMTNAIHMNSPEAIQMRNNQEEYLKLKNDIEQQKYNEKEKEKEKLIPPVKDRILKYLDSFENGDLDAWWHLTYELTFDDTDKHYGHFLTSDLIGLPAWQSINDNMQIRIVQAAKKYILSRDDVREEWFGTSIFYRPAKSGYKAFILLKKLAPDFINNLSPDIWQKWIAVIIDYPETIGLAGQDNTFLHLIKQAYENVPEEAIAILLQIIAKKNHANENLFILQKFEDFLDNKIKLKLLQMMKDTPLNPTCTQELLSFLIKSGYPEAEEYAKHLITISNGNYTDLEKSAALSLIDQADDAGWDVVWNAIQSDSDFGKDVMISMPGSPRIGHMKQLSERIGERNTAELFLWLSKQFPRKEDIVQAGAHFVGSRESIANFRNNLLESLAHKATQESINAILHIKNKQPDSDPLNYYLL